MTRQAAYDVSDPTAGRGHARRPGRGRRGPARSPSPSATSTAGASAAWPSCPTGPTSPGTAPSPATSIDEHVFAKLKALKINPSEPGRPTPSSSAGPTSTPSASCRRADEARAFLADADPDEAGAARRSPARPARVRRLLGLEVGRPAPQRGEDDGRQGRLGLPALAPRPGRRRRARSTSSPAGSSRPGARPGATRRRASTGPTATRRPPPRRSARSSSASGSSAPAATTTRSTSGPRTTTTAWPPTSATSAASRSTTSARDSLDKHEINGDEIIYLDGPARGWSSPAPAR